MKNDPTYPARFAEARQRAAQDLEDEAVRRAYEGIRHPVLYQGKQVWANTNGVREPLFETVYSDRLLIRLLEANDPEKWKPRTENTEKWDGNLDNLSPAQLDVLADHFLKMAFGNDTAAIEAEKRKYLGPGAGEV